MTPYENRSGDSGVVAYEIGSEHIRVKFRYGGTYLYTFNSAGRKAIEEMKALALAGTGLSTYISRRRPPYESYTEE